MIYIKYIIATEWRPKWLRNICKTKCVLNKPTKQAKQAH